MQKAKMPPKRKPSAVNLRDLADHEAIKRAKARRQAAQADLISEMENEVAMAKALSKDPEFVKQYQKRRKIMIVPKMLYRAGNYISPKIYRGLKSAYSYVSPTLYKYAVSPLWEGVKGVGSSIARRARAVHDYMLDDDYY